MIDLICSSRFRLPRLMKMLDSLPRAIDDLAASEELRIFLAFDGDEEAYRAIEKAHRATLALYFSGHNGAVYCRNAIARRTSGSILYATDDIVFLPRSIAIAYKSLIERFPDLDGVIGFAQIGSGLNYSKIGVALMGARFAERYSERKIFFPGYFHFACQEIGRLAGKLDKLYFNEHAIIRHDSPFFNKKIPFDQAHADARKYRERDQQLSKQRNFRNLIWGDHAS